jgi:hypothetical protein
VTPTVIIYSVNDYRCLYYTLKIYDVQIYDCLGSPKYMTKGEECGLELPLVEGANGEVGMEEG